MFCDVLPDLKYGSIINTDSVYWKARPAAQSSRDTEQGSLKKLFVGYGGKVRKSASWSTALVLLLLSLDIVADGRFMSSVCRWDGGKGGKQD